MAKNEMSSLFKGHQAMKTNMQKSKAALKEKGLELQKVHLKMVDMGESLKKNGKKLEILSKKASYIEEASCNEIETVHAQVDELKNELDGVEAKLTTHVR